MIDAHYIKDTIIENNTKIVLLVVDGLGGMPSTETKLSELQTAKTPNLDFLSHSSSCGLTIPVAQGVTPGSGPGHLALFGYDPLKYYIGRGILEGLGIGIDLLPGDLASRGNFCTLDSSGNLIDRRAGRISTNLSSPLVEQLDNIIIEGCQTDVFQVQDYRFVLRMRGNNLSQAISETDPQQTGMPPLNCEPLDTKATETATYINQFTNQAKNIISNRDVANMVLLRGWSQLPDLPSFAQTYKMKSAAIAAYPMYRGLATVAGMDIIPTGKDFESEVHTLNNKMNDYDFFFLHYKPADAAGEDGDFSAKVRTLEDLDRFIPQILDLNPDVFIIAGDHSTPAAMGSHSWHPVPMMIHSKWTLGDYNKGFSEYDCRFGSLGTIQATELMSLILAHSSRLTKYGP
jgi:2,3-bisphosphoglycerate-independent phosphoglycerate mutase